MLHYKDINRNSRTPQVFKTGGWFHNIHTQKGWWSDDVFRFYGLELSDEIPSTDFVKSFYPTGEYERMIDTVKECVNEKIPLNDIFRMILPNGQSQYHFTSIEPVSDDEGNVIGVYGNMLDVTKLYSLPHTLKEGNPAFKALVTHLEEVIFHVRKDGTLIFLSPSWQKLTGFNIDESLEKTLRSFINQNDLALRDQTLNLLFSGKTGHINFDARLNRKDGNIVWCSFYGTVIKNFNNEITGFTGRIKDISNIKEHLFEIERQRDFYESILNAVPSEIAVQNAQGKYLFINKKGIANDEIRKWIIGKDDLEYAIYRNRSVEAARTRMSQREEVMRQGKMMSFEEKLVTTDQAKYYQRSVIPVYNNNKEFLYAIGYGFDITELKNQQLLNHKLTTAIEQAGDSVAIRSADGRYTYANKSFAHLFGHENPAQIVGQIWTDLIDKRSQEPDGESIKNMIDIEGKWSGRLTIKTTNGVTLNLYATINLLPGNELLYICSDKGREIEREKELEKLALVASSTNSLVIITGKDMKIEWVNDAFTRQLGYTLDEVKGKRPVSEVLAPNISQTDLSSIKTELSNTSYNQGELLVRTKDGQSVWIYYNTSAIKNENGEIIYYIGVHNNITALKEAENATLLALDKVKKLNDLKSQFISMASHEFRTPLTGIQTSADIISALTLRASSELHNEIKIHIKRITDQVEKIEEIMDDVLLIGKNEAGKIQYRPIPGHLLDYIQYAMNNMALYENNRYAGINIKVEGTPVVQQFDPQLISHVLRNLVSNAFKYSHDRPDPEITVKYYLKHTEIIVKDFGMGIPPEDVPYIFQSFHRASNAHNLPGTGLGLSIVKQFVELHGGNVSFESELGRGSTFAVSLPNVNP